MTRRLLLLSSSRDAAGVYLLHTASSIRERLGPSVGRVLFIPYAGVAISHADYAARAAVPFATLGYEPVVSTPEQCAALIKTDIIRWAKVIREAGVKPE